MLMSYLDKIRGYFSRNDFQENDKIRKYFSGKIEYYIENGYKEIYLVCKKGVKDSCRRYDQESSYPCLFLKGKTYRALENHRMFQTHFIIDEYGITWSYHVDGMWIEEVMLYDYFYSKAEWRESQIDSILK